MSGLWVAGGQSSNMDAAKDADETSITGSTRHLIGVTPKRTRNWRQFITSRTKLEKILAIGLLLVTALALSLMITLIITASNRPFTAVCQSVECVRSASMLLENMDTRFSPCDDFYRFACGRWPEAHIREGGTNSWFSDRARYLSTKMEGVLGDNATSSDPLPLVYAKSLYSSCLDTVKMDELGLEPMMSVLERSGLPGNLPDESTASSFSISQTLAKIQRVLSMDLLVQLSMAVDPKTNRTVMVVAPTMGTSSLPELVSADERLSVSSREALGIRLAYMTGVMAALQPYGNNSITDLGTAALKILVVDSQVRSDIQKTDSDEPPTLMTFVELQEMMDNANTTGTPKQRFDWSEYLTVLLEGLDKHVSINDTVYVSSPDYFVHLAKRLHKNRPESFQRYLWWFLVTSMVPHTTEELRSMKDDLYEALFKRSRLTRATKCVKYVKSFFNMAIGYKFATMDNLKETTLRRLQSGDCKNEKGTCTGGNTCIETNFFKIDRRHKIQYVFQRHLVKSMLKDITDSFGRLVESLKWMDTATKRNAAKKARAIKSFIGYPEWLLVPGQLEQLYEGLEVIEGQFLNSMVRLKSIEVKSILKTLAEPPANDTKGWVTDPLDVNAFYGRGSNAIAIPAGILQSPFYFLGLESLNYGAIGSILGHELTHAFDVEGKDYDETGRKVSWWDEAMTKEYDQRAQCFVKQYDKFGFKDENKLNGTLTLAENIADNGGLREAFHAYEHYLQRNGEEPKLPGLDKFTHQQLFFLAFANVWCEKTNDEEDINSLADVHSPNKFRVLGTLRNLEVFSRVWGCSEGSAMNPKRKCVLW